jgi:hypothetical protein
VRYTARPAGAAIVNILQSASKRASNICTGLVDEMECRPKFMEEGRSTFQIWNLILSYTARAGEPINIQQVQHKTLNSTLVQINLVPAHHPPSQQQKLQRMGQDFEEGGMY